jgi:hypothetical protein
MAAIISKNPSIAILIAPDKGPGDSPGRADRFKLTIQGSRLIFRRMNFRSEPLAGAVCRSLISSEPSPRLLVCTGVTPFVDQLKRSVDSSVP